MISGPARHKVVLIGDPMVGKTSIMHRLTNGAFLQNYTSTVGTGCGSWTSDSKVNLQIWDTAGQERYRSLGQIFYQNAEAAVIVFDKTNPESINNAEYWVKQFKTVTGVSPFIVIAANKCDVSEVENSAVKEWAKDKGYYYTETSAKTGAGIKELFQFVAKRIEDKFELSSRFVCNPPSAKLVNSETVGTLAGCC